MAKYIRYRGEFLSRAGVVWCVEIFQEAEQPFECIGALTFEADEALVIEWSATEKSEAVCGSTATLRIESPGDRTYEDLYTDVPGSIRMDVYRSGALYWSGMLDPEFYEEPYERAANYPVSLTFSDFGILGRLDYDLNGAPTLQQIIEQAVERAGINCAAIEADAMTSTYFEDGITKANTAALSVRSDNFFDEEGNPSKFKEVLKGILQPLALRIVQRAGRIYVYDLNGAYANGKVSEIEWDGDSSTMGVDKVYNKVVINFSPYSSSELLAGDISYDGEYSADKINTTDAAMGDGVYYSYFPNATDIEPDVVGFTIFLGDGSGLAYVSPKASYFHMLPVSKGATECSGVAWGFKTGVPGSTTWGAPAQKLNATAKALATWEGAGDVVMRTKDVFIPKVDRPGDYYLRIALEMLLDFRYNPFTSENELSASEQSVYDLAKANTSWAFVPVGITIYDADDTPLMHYENKGIARTSAQGHLYYAHGEWKEGRAEYGDAWFEYYDKENPVENCAILGWKANRQCIGRPDTSLRYNPDYYGASKDFKLHESLKLLDDGEYIPYPPVGGYIEVIVFAGVNAFAAYELRFAGMKPTQDAVDFNDTKRWNDNKLYDNVRWHLYKAPAIEVIKRGGNFQPVEAEDIEYAGILNENAEDKLDIDTICGSGKDICPTARGMYYRASDGKQIGKLQRAGVTDYVENLFIGTMYSQHAERKTTLSGECALNPEGTLVYTEANQPGKKFLLLSEVQDVIMDTTDAAFVEFAPDEYEAIK